MSASVRVTIADVNLQGAQALASQLQGGLAVEVNAADWDSQAAAFRQVVQQFGRIDYVYAIAGIGEKKWIPNDPKATDFEKPNLSVLDIDLTGVLYTAALGIQQMRRQSPDERGFRGKSGSSKVVKDRLLIAFPLQLR